VYLFCVCKLRRSLDLRCVKLGMFGNWMSENQRDFSKGVMKSIGWLLPRQVIFSFFFYLHSPLGCRNRLHQDLGLITKV